MWMEVIMTQISVSVMTQNGASASREAFLHIILVYVCQFL